MGGLWGAYRSWDSAVALVIAAVTSWGITRHWAETADIKIWVASAAVGCVFLLDHTNALSILTRDIDYLQQLVLDYSRGWKAQAE